MAEDDDGGSNAASSLRGAVRNFLARTLVRRRLQGGFDLGTGDEDVGDEEQDAVGELPQSEELGVGGADGRRRSVNLGRRHSQRLERTSSLQTLNLGRIKSRWAKFSVSTLDLTTFSRHDEDFEVRILTKDIYILGILTSNYSIFILQYFDRIRF